VLVRSRSIPCQDGPDQIKNRRAWLSAMRTPTRTPTFFLSSAQQSEARFFDMAPADVRIAQIVENLQRQSTSDADLCFQLLKVFTLRN
jgi:hypothetical protein